jgi:hypothetical protein
MEQVGLLIQQDLQQEEYNLGGAGTQTAGLAIGGILDSSFYNSHRRMDRCSSTN